MGKRGSSYGSGGDRKLREGKVQWRRRDVHSEKRSFVTKHEFHCGIHRYHFGTNTRCVGSRIDHEVLEQYTLQNYSIFLRFEILVSLSHQICES